MPNELKEMPKVSRRGRTPAHPYDEWFDKAAKKPQELVQGEDFDSDTKSMRHNLYRHLRDRGLKGHTVQVTREDGTETICIEILGKREDITEDKK